MGISPPVMQSCNRMFPLFDGKKKYKWIVDHVPFLENYPMENWDSRSHCMLING